MSTTDGDASSRLSNALEEILSTGDTRTPPSGEDEATAAAPGAEQVSDAADPAPVEAVADVTAPVEVPETPAVAPVEETAQPSAQPSPPDPRRESVASVPPSAPPAAPPSEFTADWSVDDDHDPGQAADEVYHLPEIVPATNPLPLPDVEPQLAPGAHATPATAVPAPSPAGPTPPAATSTAATTTARATSWGDHMAAAPTGPAAGAPLRAPGRRPRVRRVTRVLRHIDPWSTFKVALLFSAVAYVVMLTAGVLLWRVADDTGTLANVERWFTQFGWETFELKGGEIFHNAWIIGLFGVVAMTGALVLTATLFNLVSDIVGGVRLTVLEEEVIERTVSSTRRYVVRRAPAAAGADGAAATQDWDVDGDEPVAEPDAAVAAEPVVDDDDRDA